MHTCTSVYISGQHVQAGLCEHVFKHHVNGARGGVCREDILEAVERFKQAYGKK